MSALVGSMTRKYVTALTFAETLSLVMISCGGISKAISRRLTTTIRSMGNKTKTIPGPLGSPNTRPRRKITPRSYSFKIRTLFNNQNRKNPTTNKNDMKNSFLFLKNSLNPFHLHIQIFQRNDFDFFVLLNFFISAGIPDFAVNKNLSTF